MGVDPLDGVAMGFEGVAAGVNGGEDAGEECGQGSDSGRRVEGHHRWGEPIRI